MGGEVIIITQDPDVRTPDPTNPLVQARVKSPRPRTEVTQVRIAFNDDATSDDITNAVRLALKTADAIKNGFKQDLGFPK